MTLEDKYWAAGWFDSQKAKPCLEKKNPTRITWSMEVSAFLNNDLLIFFRDNFGASIKKVEIKEGYSIRLRFSKPALIRIIEEIGPYLRQKREIYERIAKEGKFTQLKGLSTNDPRCRQEVTMPSSLFDSKYQKNYAAGVLEGSCTPHFKAIFIPPEEICTAREGKKQDGLHIYITISIIAKKYLEHENISHSFCNAATKNKFKIVKRECIKKLLNNLLNYIKFRQDLKVMRSAVEWWSHPEKKFFRGQMLDNLKEQCKYYIIKINENHFDESLIKKGVDGKIARKMNIELKKAIDKNKKIVQEVKDIVKNIKPYKLRRYGIEIRNCLETIDSNFRLMNKLELKIEDVHSITALCRDCKKNKPKTEFNINKANHHGVGLYCKKCVSKKGKIKLQDPKYKEKKRQYYLDHKEEIKAYVKEYNKTYIHIKDEYDKYTNGRAVGKFFDSSKDFAEYNITLRKGRGTSKKEFYSNLEKEWSLLPTEIKDMFNLPHELTAEEIFKLRKEGFIDIDHIIPKAKIKKLVQQGHAKGMTVSPHHTFNLRPLPKQLNQNRSDSYSLLEYYPNHKKYVKNILRHIFQKYIFKNTDKSL